jgi:hypothetical protein
MQAPQPMHFFLSQVTFFPRFNASTGQASTQPLQHEYPQPQEELTHLPSFQQHFL